MKRLLEFVNKYRLERLVWCIAIAAFCWTDVADYYAMKYNKMLCVWIVLGLYYVYKQGVFKKGNRRVAVGCALAGGTIFTFFVTTNYFSHYYYYNYTLGALCIVLLLQYGLLIQSLIRNRRLPRLSLIAILLFLMMLYTQLSPMNHKNSYLVMVIILLPYVFVELQEQAKKDIFYGMVDGLCVGFLLCQGYTFLFRPYMLTENGVRWEAHSSYCTFAGLSYLQFYIGCLMKYIILCKEKSPKWFRIVAFMGAGFALALLYLTGGRSPLLGAMAITAILIAWLYRELPLKKACWIWLRKCMLIGVLSLALFPVAYAGTRYIPTILHHPDLRDSEDNRLYSFATVVLKQKFLYNGEWNDRSVKASDPWDSVKYITFSECVGGTIGRMIPGLDSVLYPIIGEDVIEAKAARLQYFCEMGYMTAWEAYETIKGECELYQQEIPDYFKTLDTQISEVQVPETQAAEAQALEIQGAEARTVDIQVIDVQATEVSDTISDETIATSEVERGDSITYGWFAEGEEYSHMQLRNALHMYALKNLNLTGHEQNSYKLYYETGLDDALGHAHNIFLIVGYDYGIPAMILVVLVFIVLASSSLKKGYVLGNPHYLLPAVLVIAMSVYGWYEAGLRWDNSFSVMIFLCCVLWRGDTEKRLPHKK